MLSPVFTEYQGERFVFFSSPHSDNGCLSNWYESQFELDARSFESAEQAFLYLKALSSGDEATALRVFAMNEPRYFARLNHQIRPFDARRWAGQREAAMRQIEHEKFAQAEELRDFLLATGDATIVNCSRNPLWSCGLQMSQVERLDRDRWVGQNLLGTILMELRDELRPPEPEPEPEPGPEPEEKPEPAAAEEPAPAPPEPQAEDADGDATPEPPHQEAAIPASEGAEPAEDQAQPQPDATSKTPVPETDETELIDSPSSFAETTVLAANEVTEVVPQTDTTDDTTAAPETEGTSQLPKVEAPADAGDELPAANAQQKADNPAIARYQQGNYPSSAELADGSILKGLIGAFTSGDSPAVRQALMQCLRDSVVAVTAVKVDPVVAATVPVREDGLSDPLIMDNGTTYRPSVLENDTGERWFPAFSSASEISNEISGQTSVIMLPMAQCVELARTHGGLAGIVVNVFTDNLILPGRTCDYIAGLPSHAGSGEDAR